MKYLQKTLVTTTATIALSLNWSQLAQAITITSTGTWSNPLGTAANVNGTGTNVISWGNPSNSSDPQSSYNFLGNEGVDLDDNELDGAVFKLGTFIHNNFPILNFNFLGATLNLNLDIKNGSILNQDFTFDFTHNETSNTPPCNPSGVTNCPDVVSIPDATSSETIEINGRTYELKILGFSDTVDSPKVDQFITEEGQANQTMLFASLNDVSVPEPGSIIGILTLTGLGLTSNQRKRSKQN